MSSIRFGPPIYDNPEMFYELYDGPLTHMLMPPEGEESRDSKGRTGVGLSLPPLRKDRGQRKACYSRITENEKIELYLRNPEILETTSSVWENGTTAGKAPNHKEKKGQKRRKSSIKKNAAYTEAITSITINQINIGRSRYGNESSLTKKLKKDNEK